MTEVKKDSHCDLLRAEGLVLSMEISNSGNGLWGQISLNQSLRKFKKKKKLYFYRLHRAEENPKSLLQS